MKKIFDIKLLYIILVMLFILPSLYHIINSGFLLEKGEYFSVFIEKPCDDFGKYLNAGIYLIFFVLIIMAYFLILKNRKKVFKNEKEIIIFILIASILFAFILPITSSDVYSYGTTGEIQSKYGANPYYDKIADVKNANDTSSNEILNAISIWDNQLVVYGPLWSLICAIITFFSFSKLSVAIILFKLSAIAIHIFNCIIIYKLCRKKFWVLFYGLNPYILFEAISNVHNDIYLVFFSLLGLYFFIKKKNLILALLFLACATCIKYLTVLLVPLLLIYYYREENVGKRILKCIKSGLIYGMFILAFYLIYLRNVETIFYVLIQQNKLKESILASLYILLNYIGKINYYVYIKYAIMAVCGGIYLIFIIKLLCKKKIKFNEIMRYYNNILLIFILVFITNMCVWYFTWLFVSVMWQKSKNIRIVMCLPLIYEICVTYYFVLNSELVIKTYAFSIISVLAVNSILILRKVIPKNFKILKKYA